MNGADNRMVFETVQRELPCWPIYFLLLCSGGIEDSVI